MTHMYHTGTAFFCTLNYVLGQCLRPLHHRSTGHRFHRPASRQCFRPLHHHSVGAQHRPEVSASTPTLAGDLYFKLTRVNFKCKFYREMTAQKNCKTARKKRAPKQTSPSAPRLSYSSSSSSDKDLISKQYYHESSVDIYTVMLFKAFN